MPDAYSPIRSLASLCILALSASTFAVMLAADGGRFDSLGKGRFDVVGWDIRGAGESAPVECFRSEKARARFFSGWSIPTTAPESLLYVIKTGALAHRCGEVSGRILRHI